METNPDKSFDELMDLVNKIRLTDLPPGRDLKFREGDTVLRFSPSNDVGISNKLHSKFRKGKVLKVLGRRTYLIQDLDSESQLVCDGRNLRRGGV